MCRVAIVAVLLGCVVHQARAQDVVVVEVEEEVDVAVANNAFVMGIEQFDYWVFGQRMPKAQRSKSYDAQLSLVMQSIERCCPLSDAQRDKVRLAAQGDVHRFEKEVAAGKALFEKKRRDQNGINELWQDVQPLQQKFQAGIFGDQSLMQKVIAKVLEPPQVQQWQTIQDERRRFQLQAQVDFVVEQFADSLALNPGQRKAFAEIMGKPGLDEIPRNQSYFAYWLIGRVVKAPDEQLEPFKKSLDKAQADALDRQINQYRQVLPTLKQQGFVE